MGPIRHCLWVGAADGAWEGAPNEWMLNRNCTARGLCWPCGKRRPALAPQLPWGLWRRGGSAQEPRGGFRLSTGRSLLKGPREGSGVTTGPGVAGALVVLNRTVPCLGSPIPCPGDAWAPWSCQGAEGWPCWAALPGGAGQAEGGRVGHRGCLLELDFTSVRRRVSLFSLA